MKDDYLWSRSGEPDPEVQALEAILCRLRHEPRPLVLPPADRAAARQPSRTRALAAPLALAAVVVLLVAGTWRARFSPSGPPAAGSAPAWTAAPLAAGASLAARPLVGEVRVPAGGWLETGEGGAAELRAGEVGTVRVGPRSRVRVVSAAPGDHRLALARGSLDAFIWASPRQFFVETPSAVAVDLGCAYRLEVDEDGSGRLRVTLGWVGFELDGRESLVPSGAVCATRPGRGPGTPHFEDASASFRASLERVDEAGATVDPAVLDRVLREARPRDALSLWHLLPRLDRAAAARVYDRLAALAPPPPGVTRDRVLGRDRGALDAWWDSLGLAPVSRFREWMR